MSETPAPTPSTPSGKPRIEIRRILGIVAIIAAILIYFFWDDIHDIIRPATPVPGKISAEALDPQNETTVEAGPLTATFSRIGAVMTGLTWTSPDGRHKETLIGQEIPNQAFALLIPDLDPAACFTMTGPEDVNDELLGPKLKWKQISFTCTNDKLTVKKTFRICDGTPPAGVAPIELNVFVRYQPGVPKQGYMLHVANAVGDPSKLKADDGLITIHADRVTTQYPTRQIRKIVQWPTQNDKDAAGNSYSGPASLDWVALGNRYFTLNVQPNVPIKNATMIFVRTSKTSSSIELNVPPKEGTSGVEDTYRIYAGPKDYTALAALPGRQQDAINYWFLGRPAIQLLISVHDKTIRNYGVAIILITIAFRLLMWPVTSYNLRAMVDIKLANAKLKDLDAHEPPRSEAPARAEWLKQVRPWEDMQRKATIGVFLPMAILLPVLLILYYALEVGFEFWHQPFVLWISDISQRDPIFLLPVLMGLAMMGQLRTMTRDPKTDKSWLVMSIGLTVLFAFFSAGVVLFWLTDTLVGWFQLKVIKRSHRKQTEPAPSEASA